MCDESSWPDVDQNTVCGDCKVKFFWLSCGALIKELQLLYSGSGDPHEQRLPQLLELLLLLGSEVHGGLGGGP